MSKYVSWKNPESEDCNTDLSDKFKDLESSDVLILHQATIILQNRITKNWRAAAGVLFTQWTLP